MSVKARIVKLKCQKCGRVAKIAYPPYWKEPKKLLQCGKCGGDIKVETEQGD